MACVLECVSNLCLSHDSLGLKNMVSASIVPLKRHTLLLLLLLSFNNLYFSLMGRSSVHCMFATTSYLGEICEKPHKVN